MGSLSSVASPELTQCCFSGRDSQLPDDASVSQRVAALETYLAQLQQSVHQIEREVRSSRRRSPRERGESGIRFGSELLQDIDHQPNQRPPRSTDYRRTRLTYAVSANEAQALSEDDESSPYSAAGSAHDCDALKAHKAEGEGHSPTSSTCSAHVGVASEGTSNEETGRVFRAQTLLSAIMPEVDDIEVERHHSCTSYNCMEVTDQFNRLGDFSQDNGISMP